MTRYRTLLSFAITLLHVVFVDMVFIYFMKIIALFKTPAISFLFFIPVD